MGMLGRLVTTPLGLFTAGVLLVTLVPPLGRLALFLLGAIVLLAVAAGVLTLLVIVNDAAGGADRAQKTRTRQRSDQHPQRLQLGQNRRVDPAHRDLDVATIDDYRQ